MGLNGRIKVEKEFDRQIVVDAYIDEIKKITLNYRFSMINKNNVV